MSRVPKEVGGRASAQTQNKTLAMQRASPAAETLGALDREARAKEGWTQHPDEGPLLLVPPKGLHHTPAAVLNRVQRLCAQSTPVLCFPFLGPTLGEGPRGAVPMCHLSAPRC